MKRRERKREDKKRGRDKKRGEQRAKEKIVTGLNRNRTIE